MKERGKRKKATIIVHLFFQGEVKLFTFTLVAVDSEREHEVNSPSGR